MQTPGKQRALAEIDAVCAAKKTYGISNEACAELIAEMREDDLRYARGLSSGLSKVIR